MVFLADTLKRLTSRYLKTPYSNIGKIFNIVSIQIEEARRTLDKIEQCRDVDQAVGASLDRIGRNVGQARGNSPDIDYRKLIKTKIIANRSRGDIETINEVLDVLMGEAYLGVQEAWNHAGYHNEPAALVIREKDLADYIEKEYEEYFDVPLYLNGEFTLSGVKQLNGGFVYDAVETLPQRIESMRMMKEIAKRIISGGVRVYWETPVSVVSGISLTHDVRPGGAVTPKNANKIQHQPSMLEIVHVSGFSKTNRLDGFYTLNGEAFLNGEKDFLIHKVEIREVSA
ncbi:DUF2612 domain-containing protein [uncultured Brevibacillus sp.]|uniref:DUF2612 domain-containing protein n=1 Tax=uncultured Brevibacillus sp. TaxID=169970 RepID=UPI00259318B9|nr:DUF2612 domain-containing protein [uncultured Brevibacillus sp.]